MALGLREAISQWLEYRTAEVRPTISDADYRWVLLDFAQYVDNHHPSATPSDITISLLRSYLGSGERAHEQASGRARRISVLKVTFRWWHRTGLSARNAADQLQLPRLPRRQPPPIPLKELIETYQKAHPLARRRPSFRRDVSAEQLAEHRGAVRTVCWSKSTRSVR